MGKRKTLKQVKFEIYELVGDEFTLLSTEYKNNKEHLLFTHNICKNTFTMNLNHFLRGNRCPYCAGNVKKTLKSHAQEINEITNGEYGIIGEYINNKTKIKYIHYKCGNIFEMLPNNFQQGQRCPICSRIEGAKKRPQNKPKSTEEYKQEVFNLKGNEFEVIGEYINNKTKILMKHNTCGHEFSILPTDFLSHDNGCPFCKKSKGEKKIEKWLNKYHFKYEVQVSFSDCRNILPLRFDFKIYLKGGSFILLEYNGIQHYEKQRHIYPETFEIQQKRDRIKQKYCKEHSIPLYIIRFDEDIEERLKEILDV